MKQISIMRLGSRVETYAVEDDATVRDVLIAAEYDVGSDTTILLNGVQTSLDIVPANGSTIAIAVNAKNGC